MSAGKRGSVLEMAIPSEDVPDASIRTLGALRRAEAACTRCPLYQFATQVVPGEGPVHASMMLVGEQPGDQEDLAGHPFVGPAGRILDSALGEAGISRSQVFVTNAVKHFKHEMRGKRRLHKRPNGSEIERCRWWLERERAIVGPAAIVALGATAARSVLGRTVACPRDSRAGAKVGRRNRGGRDDPSLVPAADQGCGGQAAGIPQFRQRPATARETLGAGKPT